MFYGTQAATGHTSFIAGSCWMLISLTDDMKEELQAINKMAQDNVDFVDFLKRFFEFVELHSKAKQLRFSNIRTDRSIRV